jgi:hypothetical protein
MLKMRMHSGNPVRGAFGGTVGFSPSSAEIESSVLQKKVVI